MANTDMKITSSAFDDGGEIPKRYTCAGENINPTIHIDGVPEDAESLVLILEDPDVNPKLAEEGVWYHWVIFNLAPSRKLIREGEEPDAVAGEGSSDNLEYYGPCTPPPEGTHEYVFRLYALDEKLGLEEGATGAQVKHAMEGNIIAEAAYTGTYARGEEADE